MTADATPATTPSAALPGPDARSAHPPAPGPHWSGRDPLEKHPWRAAILSVVPGLGQVYTGYYQLGFVHALVVGSLFTLLAFEVLPTLIPLLSIFLLFFWLYNVVDAFRRAKLYNEARAGRLDVEIPTDLSLPDFRGSIAGGAAFVVLGFLLLMHTAFGLSLAWVADWWPLALIGFGAYLVALAVRDRRERGTAGVEAAE